MHLISPRPETGFKLEYRFGRDSGELFGPTSELGCVSRRLEVARTVPKRHGKERSVSRDRCSEEESDSRAVAAWIASRSLLATLYFETSPACGADSSIQIFPDKEIINDYRLGARTEFSPVDARHRNGESPRRLDGPVRLRGLIGYVKR